MRDQADERLLESRTGEENSVRCYDHRSQCEVDKHKVEDRHVVEEDSPHSAEHVLLRLRITLIERRAEGSSRFESYYLPPEPFW